MKKFGENLEIGKYMLRPTEQEIFCTKDDGYRGAWHAQPPLFEYGYKYSGGLGTYCSSHSPFAIFAKEVNKTFFCWGGMVKNQHSRPRNWDFCTGQQIHMVSYYDHKTGLVPRPTILFDKFCADTHDNPVISIDSQGYIWIFSPSHGAWTTPSFIHRSKEPYSIEKFETVLETLFAYPQPHWLKKYGFIFLHTRYQDGRMLHIQNTVNDFNCSAPRPIAGIEQGHYHVSTSNNEKISVAFNFHPKIGGLDSRTNLYYIESTDGGVTWRNIHGKAIETPICEIRNPALVHDYQSQNRFVYLMDINLTSEGRPVILY
ncbi:MAG TPA: BNR-4 repeat-containing protein, partial [Victivallales bacterium]|nr:BNR-4 repeat-containing protein [Victivallales bacterium]